MRKKSGSALVNSKARTVGAPVAWSASRSASRPMSAASRTPSTRFVGGWSMVTRPTPSSRVKARGP
jgi:hypothetical protein